MSTVTSKSNVAAAKLTQRPQWALITPATTRPEWWFRRWRYWQVCLPESKSSEQTVPDYCHEGLQQTDNSGGSVTKIEPRSDLVENDPGNRVWATVLRHRPTERVKPSPRRR